MTGETNRRGRVSRWVVGTGIAGTVFIAGLAFWLSFTGLTHLAVRAGISEQQAWAWPLIVDGIIVVATVAVVALRERKGQGYSWLLLISGALVSVTANAVQAAMPLDMALPPALAAAVSAVPPLVLLAITHLTVVLARSEDTRTINPVTEPENLSLAAKLPLVESDPPEALGFPPPATTSMSEQVLTTATMQVETAQPEDSRAHDVMAGESEPVLVPATAVEPSVPLDSDTTADGLSEVGLRRMLLGVEAEPAGSSGVGEGSRTWLVEEAMRLKAEGLSNRLIGDQLGVDPTTVGRWLKKHQQGDNQ